MLTDGALRLLILLHLHQQGYSPFTLAYIFLLYEFMGILTNFTAGKLGKRFGLSTLLITGICLQTVSLLTLGLIPTQVETASTIILLIIFQGICGIAKDLTKMSSKSAIKLVVPQDAESSLFKWVAVLTGSKNALKGVGFFVGSALLTLFGFVNALWIMAGGLFLILFTSIMLPEDMGKIKQKVNFKELFSKSQEINILSAARFFLFGSRDVWFVVGLPVFLEGTLGWSFYEVGGFMACWVIGYGIIQSLAPTLIQKFGSGEPPQSKTIQFWTFTLTVVPAAIALALQLGLPANLVIVGGLMLFGIVFAFNSAVHSYLVLAFTDDDKVALNVGFYYMANSGGRLAGTVLSGLVYQISGLVGCLWVSMLFVLAAALVSLKLPDPQPSKAIAWKAGSGK